MNVNQYAYCKDRRNFGWQCFFSDRNELLFSIPQRVDLRKNYILKSPVSRGTQLGVQKGLSIALTENVTLGPHGIAHTEGGWPKDVNNLDEEQTLRHRKKIEREDAWPKVVDLSKAAGNCILQNSAVNIYEDYFSEYEKLEIRKTFKARPIKLYHDPLFSSRPLVQLDWCPGDKYHVLTLHTETDFFPITDGPNEFYIWDIKNPLKPNVTLSGPTWTRKAHFCPKDNTLVAGGLTNGMVAVWDARIGGKPQMMSELQSAHREPVSALCWVCSSEGLEFYSGSTEGTIHYWDTRNLQNWKKELFLYPNESDSPQRLHSHGCTVIQSEFTFPERFVAGNDLGHVFLGNRKGKTQIECIPYNYKLFAGPIRTIERNPFLVRNFLIIADWTARIWTEEFCEFPTTLCVYKNSELMCGTWSTSRCSVFATGDMDGVLDFWDLLLDRREPIFSLAFKHNIEAIQFSGDGEFVVVSFSNGDFQLIELDDALRHCNTEDKNRLSKIFEEEMARSKLLKNRVDDIKLDGKLSKEDNKLVKEKTVLYETEGETDTINTEEETVGAEQEDAKLEPDIDDEKGEEERRDNVDPEVAKVKDIFFRIINEVKEDWKKKHFVNDPTPFDSESIDFKSDTIIEETE